jgi:hypothetical protein
MSFMIDFIRKKVSLSHEPTEKASVQQTYSKEEIKYAKTFIEQDLERRFKENSYKNGGDISKLMFEVAAILILNAAFDRTTARKSLWDTIPEILEQTKINAKTYHSWVVTSLQIGGAIVGIGTGIVAGGQMGSAIYVASTAAPASFAATNLSSLIAKISAYQQVGSGVSQMGSTSGQLWSQHLTGKRTLGEGRVNILMLIRDRQKEVDGTESRKVQEGIDQINRTEQARHDIFGRMGG